MNNLPKLNRPFISAYLLFLLTSTIGLFLMKKGDLVLFFSRNRSDIGDLVFKNWTLLGDGVIFGLISLVFLFFRYRVSVVSALLGVSVMIVSFITKSIFALDRPLPYFQKVGMADQLTFVAGVEVHTGATSFPSGHTMTAFALFAFLSFLLIQRKWIGILMLVAAAGVGLSRVYLVQHFLQDIYLGSLIGVGLAILWHWIQSGWEKEWLDQNLLLSLR